MGVDPSACTYTPAVAEAATCTWQAAGATETLSAEVVALQTCLAASRIAAYDPDMNCLEHISGPACGESYECTYVADTSDTSDKTSGASGRGLRGRPCSCRAAVLDSY